MISTIQTPASGAGERASMAGEPGSTDPRLKPAAHEFEAYLMKDFLEPLQHDTLFDDDGKDSDDGGANALMNFGSEALAKAISERGGFGIAAKILGRLDKEQGSPAPGRVGSKDFLKMVRET